MPRFGIIFVIILASLLIRQILLVFIYRKKNFDESKTKNIANGITTQAEIKIMFGKPFKTGIQNGQPVWVYEYNRYYLTDNDVSKDLIIIFGPNGVVQSHQFMTSEPTP